jgi:LacI family transcriptional regulator
MSSPRKVALLLESSHEFGRGLMFGFIRYSRIYGPWIFYKQTGGRNRRWPSLKDWQPDGIVMRLKDKIPPAPAIGIRNKRTGSLEPGPRWPRIVGDNQAFGRMAAKHFLERKFRHFGFCSHADRPWLLSRGRAFTESIAEAGFQAYVYNDLYKRHYNNWAMEEKHLIKWLKTLPIPIGIMTSSDDRAQELIEAARGTGYRIPEDVAVLGVDNDEFICESCVPELSSIALDFERAGYEAACLLDRLMSGEETMKGQRIVIQPSHIVTRRSTDVWVIDDPVVTNALHYIRENIRKPLQATDVAKGISVSRSCLYSRFLKVLGRSVYDEIRKARIQAISSLLVDRNLSIEEISGAFGYNSSAHFARYFKTATGMTPSTYRKKH